MTQKIIDEFNGNVAIGEIPVSLKLSTKLNLLNDADDVRMLRESAAEQFDMNKLRAKYRDILLRSAEFKGDNTLTERDVDIAVDNYMDSFYNFYPEDRTEFSTKVAAVYVNRRKHFKTYGIPALAVLALSSVLWGGSMAVKELSLRASERNVEEQVEESYRKRLSLANQTQNLESQQRLVENADDLVEVIRTAKDGLSSTSSFFEEFCDDGTAIDDVTRENYKEVEQHLASITESLDGVASQVSKGENVIRFEQDILTTKQSLDSLIGEIKSSNPPSVLETRADASYNSGVASLENRQLNEGRQYVQELRGLKADVKAFEVLPAQLEQLYSSIKEVVKEQIASEKADELHSEGKTHVKQVDVSSLQQTINNLRELNTVLNQSYTVKIVSRPGVKSGIDRYYTDENGRRASGWYLIVEATDSNGNVLVKQVTSEENGRTESVRMWGERIPNAVYERVKSDKLDDGIIQNNVFAKKEKGYTTEEVLMSGVSERGQINNW